MKQLIIVAAMAATLTTAWGQVTTSPYSKQGFGLLNDNASGIQRQMGGVGYAMQNGRVINAMNPASYSQVDSLTFMWDVGVGLTNLWSQEGDKTGYNFGGGLDYITGQFRITKHLGGSFGLIPFSSVGYTFGNKLDKTLDLTLRLGKRTMGRLAWNMIPKPHRKIGLSYEIWHEDIDLYQGKHRSDAIKFIYQKANATLFAFDALNLNVDLGIAWEHYHHYDVLNSAYSVIEFLKNEYYFNYHASAQYNSEDHWYFTHTGMRAEALYAYYTDNFAQWKDHAGFSEVSARWRMTMPLTGTTHLQPMIYGRMLFGKDIPATAMNMLGGNRGGIYYAQQLPFSGFGHCHVMDKNVLVAGLKVQQRLFKEHYIMVKGHVAQQNNKLGDIFDGKPIWGAQIGYAYNSILGPLGGSLSWSNFTKQVSIYINLGFEF